MAAPPSNANVRATHNQRHHWENRSDDWKDFHGIVRVILVNRFKPILFKIILTKGTNDPNASQTFPEN